MLPSHSLYAESGAAVDMRDLEEEDVMQIVDELFEDLLQDAVQDMALPGNTICARRDFARSYHICKT